MDLPVANDFVEPQSDLRGSPLHTRRNLLSMGAAGVAGFLGTAPASAARAGKVEPAASETNVKSFGARGDGASDETAAFQRALDSAHSAGGGIVYAPPGRYLFRGVLSVPDGVTLRGSYSCVPSHTGLRDRTQPKPGDDGTALLATTGRGKEDGEPFITLNTNSSIAGLTIYYPEQVTDAVPIAYPWTIAMRGKNPAALDLELLNPYQGIDASRNERHNIRNICGQPLRRGIWVDAIYDIGRIENVHFNPWWTGRGPLYDWQTQNGEAFIFGRADWEYVLNTFCFGYHVGYKFVHTGPGECNGNFLGIGADDCNRAVLVEQSAPYGLLITNGEFTSFHGDDPTMVEVLETNRGVVRFSNSAFWGGQGHSYGLYWLEQGGTPAHRTFARHTIDESFSQSHALKLADLDGDGSTYLITGKRYRGHNGDDPGSYEPNVIYAYKINRDATFTRIPLSYSGTAGVGTQIIAEDFDKDGDIDIAVAGKLGVHFLENLKIDKIPKETREAQQPFERKWPFPNEGEEVPQEDSPK
ncbi:MAG TPA: glycosyl hydrolase family 28-related protein [Acidobacteriaceae bacterium]